MDWKWFIVAFIVIIIAWYIYKRLSTSPTSVEIKPMPKSKQEATVPIKVDPIAPYFTPARETVPVDNSMTISSCPFSRPYSTDLPMVDMPRCTLMMETSHKLSELKHVSKNDSTLAHT